MNTILIIKCLALSLLPVGIDAAVSWNDLTEMRKNTIRYKAKIERKEEKAKKKNEDVLIKKFIEASSNNTLQSNTYIR
jgi:hypothetical protein